MKEIKLPLIGIIDKCDYNRFLGLFKKEPKYALQKIEHHIVGDDFIIKIPATYTDSYVLLLGMDLGLQIFLLNRKEKTNSDFKKLVEVAANIKSDAILYQD